VDTLEGNHIGPKERSCSRSIVINQTPTFNVRSQFPAAAYKARGMKRGRMFLEVYEVESCT
jgi:hypothetical protein